jgi:hypothetical protein
MTHSLDSVLPGWHKLFLPLDDIFVSNRQRPIPVISCVNETVVALCASSAFWALILHAYTHQH